MYESGNHLIGQYINEQLDGIWEFYNPKGELYLHTEYSKNVFIKKW
jgi:hypothetical protein